MKHCKRCLIPEAVPNIEIGEDGICNLCNNFDFDSNKEVSAKHIKLRHKRLKILDEAIKQAGGQGEYDCLVPVSGGKDSLFLLYKLKKEYGLKILAFTTDINIPPLAWKNIKRTVEKLDIHHLSFTPSISFYKKLFKFLLTHQEERGAVYTVSYVYAPLFEGDAITVAVQKHIPLIFAGYSPGQPEPERMEFEFSRKLITETDWTPPALKTSGVFSDEELRHFYNPKRFEQDIQFPRYFAPFHAWDYNQAEIMDTVVKLGLVPNKKSANPIFTNYPINWLLMYSDLKNFGYNPYHPEFSALIREGKASKRYWQVMAPIVNFMIRHKIFWAKDVKRMLNWLEIKEDDLKITEPKGAYDPVL